MEISIRGRTSKDTPALPPAVAIEPTSDGDDDDYDDDHDDNFDDDDYDDDDHDDE
jgi:hypothetical protein